MHWFMWVPHPSLLEEHPRVIGRFTIVYQSEVDILGQNNYKYTPAITKCSFQIPNPNRIWALVELFGNNGRFSKWWSSKIVLSFCFSPKYQPKGGPSL